MYKVWAIYDTQTRIKTNLARSWFDAHRRVLNMRLFNFQFFLVTTQLMVWLVLTTKTTGEELGKDDVMAKKVSFKLSSGVTRTNAETQS